MKLRDFAYYRTGGRCQALYEPKSIADLAKIVSALAATQQKYFVLGGGTNSLVLDEDWSGAVIIFSRMKRIEVNDNEIYCEAGADNSDIAKKALEAELIGLSWMYRLPGQIGGTVRMNARCYGGEISQVVTKIDAVLPDGQIKQYSSEDGVFRGYKDTLFMDNGAIIAGATIRLEKGDSKLVQQQMTYCEKDRIEKGQFTFPSCGCVFKNNYQVGIPSGMLLDRAGVHKLQHERVQINPKHANFVFNKGASSRDILEVTLRMRELVYQEFGVWLEYEMEILGDLPDDLKRKVQETRKPQWDEPRLSTLRQEFQRR